MLFSHCLISSPRIRFRIKYQIFTHTSVASIIIENPLTEKYLEEVKRQGIWVDAMFRSIKEGELPMRIFKA
jgi:hypothetical protein